MQSSLIARAGFWACCLLSWMCVMTFWMSEDKWALALGSSALPSFRWNKKYCRPTVIGIKNWMYSFKGIHLHYGPLHFWRAQKYCLEVIPSYCLLLRFEVFTLCPVVLFSAPECVDTGCFIFWGWFWGQPVLNLEVSSLVNGEIE